MRKSLIQSCVPAAISGWLISAAVGCNAGAGHSETFAVRVRAVDDYGMPLPNLQLALGTGSLGATDDSGQRTFRVPGKEGQRVELSAACPEAFHGPRERPTLLLQRATGPDGADKPSELVLTCEANEHVAVVAVKTQPNLPIVLHGQTVARTGPAGTAHVMLREPPGSAFQLTLDTGNRPELRPENPSRVFTVTQQDAFAVWDQPFETGKKPAPKKRVHAKRTAALDDTPPAP